MAWAMKHRVSPEALYELGQITGQRSVHHVPDGRDDIRLAVQSWGGALWRNNSGAYTDRTKRPVRQVRYGLGNDSAALNDVFKSSDYIGIAPGGRFLAVEWKPRGWRYMPGDKHTTAQAAFLGRVNELGGVGTFATCAGEVARAINQA